MTAAERAARTRALADAAVPQQAVQGSEPHGVVGCERRGAPTGGADSPCASCRPGLAGCPLRSPNRGRGARSRPGVLSEQQRAAIRAQVRALPPLTDGQVDGLCETILNARARWQQHDSSRAPASEA